MMKIWSGISKSEAMRLSNYRISITMITRTRLNQFGCYFVIFQEVIRMMVDDGYRIHVMQVSDAGFISECGWRSVETIYSKKPYTKWFLQLEIIIIFDLHNNYGHPTSSHPQVHPQIRDESFFYAFSIVYWYSVMISTSKNSRSDQCVSWNSQKTDLHNNYGRSVDVMSK